MTVKSTRPTAIDWLVMLALAILALAVYARTLAPDVLPGDAGEFQFAAWRLGLSHPTGYPLYMLLGNLWQHLLALAGVNPAVALNWLSALFAALATAVMYLLMLDVPVSSSIARRMVAAFASLMLAFNLTFWSQALLAEVYTLHALLLLLLLLALQNITESSGESQRVINPRRLVWIAFLFGLSLTHHAMTMLTAPAILVYLWAVDRNWWRMPGRIWLATLAALALPLALYAYIPLRSGPSASPWLHQRLGDSTLSLYQNDWTSFLAFITGRSISVGFLNVDEAIANIPQAGALWYQHFGILGLVLMVLGVYVLADKRRPMLWLTAGIAIAQQLFNLFYAIGDIAVYYIPLYVVGVIWAGYGAAGLAEGLWLRTGANAQTKGRYTPSRGHVSALIVLILFLLPANALMENYEVVRTVDNYAARAMWEEILAALPTGNSILVSNDRDEIPPLFYLQYVEARAPGITALHPLMTPDERFVDLGTTIDTALSEAGDTPVYLIKPMPGLEIKYSLDSSNPPLVRVENMETGAPSVPVDSPFDGLTLLGYDWQPSGSDIRVSLHWQVNEPLNSDYTTSVQLFDAANNRLAQSDLPPGGVYYPTSLWKPGETLLEQHLLERALPLPGEGVLLQISMYSGPELEQLAPPLQIELDGIPGR